VPGFTPSVRLAGPALGLVLGLLMTLAAPAETARLRIVALGASNTAGWGVAPAESYPAQLEALLTANDVPASVINAGIPGDTTAGMLGRLEREVAPGTDLVILQPGSNDERYGSGAERAGNIAEMGRRLAARGTKLLIIENSMLSELPASELREDGIHYTPLGYRILAQRVLPLLLEALAKR
jgi:acyl-CoA thioesterase-1